jgi:hypothetical protein
LEALMSYPRRRSGLPGLLRKRILLPALAVVILLAVFVLGLTFARSNPTGVAAAADWARGIVGPGAVAAVEDVYYRGADVYNRLHYRLTGDTSSWTLAGPLPTATPSCVSGSSSAQTNASGVCESKGGGPVISTPKPSGIGFAGQAGIQAAPTPNSSQPAIGNPQTAISDTLSVLPTRAPAAQQHVSGEATNSTSPEPAVRSSANANPKPDISALTPLIADGKLPGEGVWQPLRTGNQPTDQPPLLWQTVFRPDPDRPFARVALVAMDLSRSQLHLMIGTREPVSPLPANGKRSGAIPLADVADGRVLAAWNGGFRATHGHYGIMTDGTVWLPAISGMQTVAIAPDGGVTMGAWGRGVKAEGDWLAWRQNNPPLIEAGTVNPDVLTYANTIRWGASIDGAVFIWRSGMGLAQNGRWLIYAAGNSLSVATLTAALHAAGCDEAMQLDVNATFERFVTFAPQAQTVKLGGREVQLTLTSQKLIDQMQGGPTQFLLPDDRDFFYLTRK